MGFRKKLNYLSSTTARPPHEFHERDLNSEDNNSDHVVTILIIAHFRKRLAKKKLSRNDKLNLDEKILNLKSFKSNLKSEIKNYCIDPNNISIGDIIGIGT